MWHPWQNFPGLFLSCPAVSQTSASLPPLRGWTVWKAGNGAWAAQSGEQQPFCRAHSVWQPLCLCPGHIPSLPPPGAGAVPQPLLRAWMDSWLSPFQLEQPKISDLVQEEPVPPSHGAHLRSSSALPSPGSCWKKQGWGGPAWLILLSVLWCWISEVWTTAGCGGQAEPATSTCPGLTGSDLPGFRA